MPFMDKKNERSVQVGVYALTGLFLLMGNLFGFGPSTHLFSGINLGHVLGAFLLYFAWKAYKRN